MAISDGRRRGLGMLGRGAVALALAALAAGLSGCEERGGTPFVIAAGSENRTVEPLVQEFCRGRGFACRMDYKGSLDIGLALADGTGTFDAVWPANAIWVDMFDAGRRVRDLTPVMRSPVILGVRRSKAEALGWVGRPVSSADIVGAVRAGRLTYLSSSATQSNSGAGAYLAMLSAALGHPDAITRADLDRPGVQDTVRALLSGTARTAGSSAWLSDLYLKGLDEGRAYDAMWNYEGVLAETNAALRARGAEPLYAVYPSDGVAAANSPLGFVERGRGQPVAAFFADLQRHLLSPGSQERIQELGRRPAVGEATAPAADPSWNYDPRRLVTLVRMPEPPVVRAALELYQEALRRPSLTAYCLDFSGSMNGEGERAVRDAMRLVLSRQESSRLLVQHSDADRIMVLPFDGDVRWSRDGTGAEADSAALLAAVQAERAGGGTDIYACARRALREIRATPGLGRYLPAIVLMTDGRSTDHMAAFMADWRAANLDVPVFGVSFGDADLTQLNAIAAATGARVFDGKSSMREAFRTVRGYN